VPGIKQEKAVLRRGCSRQGGSPGAEAARAIRDALLSRPELQMAGTIAVYYSVGAEPDTRGLVYAVEARQLQSCCRSCGRR
jgi:5-formyltetrahydrofolate cyclo-ligase